MTDKTDINDIPDLRVRLEKIAEVRKSKKKKINALGYAVYSDYEEGSNENAGSSEESTSPMSHAQNISTTTNLPPSSSTVDNDVVNYIPKENFNIFKEEFSTPATPSKKKLYNMGEYYDSSDDYDADYVTKIDLKKFSATTKSKDVYTTAPLEAYSTHPTDVTNTRPTPVTYPPDRQPTVQYFPPTKKVIQTTTPKVTPKVNIDEYDDEFKNKVNQFTYNEPSKTVYDFSFGTASPAQTNAYEYPEKETTKPHYTTIFQADNLDKNLYLTNQPRATEPQDGFVPSNGNFNRASYVIKHYRDFIADAAKGSEEDKTSAYLPFTVAPIQSVTVNEISKLSGLKEPKRGEEYDFNAQFRKEIVNRFVDNFNENSDRFKVDFPILYNNSIVHRKMEENGKVLASSSATMKRLYEAASPKTDFLSQVKPCDANCESMAVVDLSPAYELHYYVPEQEEKAEMEYRPNTVPYRYRL